MKHIIILTLLLLAVFSVRCSIKDHLEEKAKEVLNLDKRHMPEKVEDVAEDIQSGFDHTKDALKKTLHAATEDGIIHKAKHAYEGVKDGLKITKDAKDVTIDSQKVGIAGAKDAAQESVHIYRKHGDTGSKVEDAKEFVKDELDESKEAFKDGLHGGLKEKTEKVVDAVSEGIKDVSESIKSHIGSKDHSDDKLDGLKKVGENIKSAVGLDKSDDKHQGLGEKIKSAVGLGDDEDKHKGVGETIKSAVGLDKSDDKHQGIGEKIKSAVGLGDDAHEKHEKEHKKHIVDQDL